MSDSGFDRPRRLAACEGEREAAALLDLTHGWKAPFVLADRVEQIRRDQMRVGVDDHLQFSVLRRLFYICRGDRVGDL